MGQTQDALKADAAQRIRELAPLHTPKNARRYHFAMRANAPVYNMLGLPADPPVDEGTVVDTRWPWVVVKTKPTTFVAYHAEMFREPLEVGCKARIEAYARRHFDGRRLDEPVLEKSGDFVVRRFIIGDTRSPIPVEKPKCEYLQHMIDQIETMRAPDGLRTVAQILVDAKARDFTTVDPGDDEDVIEKAPTLACVVSSGKYAGPLQIIYRRAMDYYEVRTSQETVEDVDFESLGSVLERLVDDGEWRFAKVEVLGKAKRKAKS